MKRGSMTAVNNFFNAGLKDLAQTHISCDRLCVKLAPFKAKMAKNALFRVAFTKKEITHLESCHKRIFP